MDTPISRAEHEEFRKRMEEANNRQDKRIELLEEGLQKQTTLLASIEKLAVNMETMQKELTKQGKRLEVLEGRDGEKWRSVVGYIITAVICIVIGYIASRLGLQTN